MKKLVISCFFLLTVVACSFPSKPTPAVIPTFTAVAIRTATITQTLAMTPLLPSETPAVGAEWNGIPIMPGAMAGEGDEDGYVFTAQATPQQVQEYYQLELEKRGWQPLPQSDDDASMTLIYMNNVSETLTISILAKDDEVLVLLVK